MKTTIYNKIKLPKYATVLLLTLICFTSTIQAQKAITNTPVIKTQADIDWEELIDVMSNLGTGYQASKKGDVIERRRYMDELMKNRSRLVKVFWDKYPKDTRRGQALSMFFSPYAEPSFISKVVSDSLKAVIAIIPSKDFKRALRLVPVDDIAYKQWRQTGDDMVSSVLNSNVDMETKAVAEFQLIKRELNHALKLDQKLIKEKSEANYWNRFEVQYWQHICLRLERFVNKYAVLEIVSECVQSVLGFIKNYSVTASDTYWHYFYETTGTHNTLADQIGIKTLHKLASENIAAIEALKIMDHAKPLDITFTAMDGSHIDLATMRGKVVLIDFWATYCGPCIKEMPHVRKLYDKYRDQGFEVIGIAANDDAAKSGIQDILKKTGANWPQRLDKGSQASVSFHALYKIKALPTVWLLNKEGVIVDTNARGARLEPLIRKYLELEEE
ncbi:TlpA disulfide reductase family protein [Flavivirga abyssicola]|uniref:TlpA family protein disulfide reductase n=1 Tax=Flavivirga abyssicola TaxID=3063533 RepID=UPI0026DFAB31|nr:TlpA disulfide reductase family protein [Flavivirga sp. MEBiC07777]WVK14150.1 TlpA disulfide reductase family protein [Flavivirga sp. MEBiC07777]